MKGLITIVFIIWVGENQSVQSGSCIIDLIDQTIHALLKGLFLQNIVELD